MCATGQGKATTVRQAHRLSHHQKPKGAWALKDQNCQEEFVVDFFGVLLHYLKKNTVLVATRYFLSFHYRPVVLHCSCQRFVRLPKGMRGTLRRITQTILVEVDCTNYATIWLQYTNYMQILLYIYIRIYTSNHACIRTKNNAPRKLRNLNIDNKE